MVEIETQQSGMPNEGFVAAACESAGESAIIEVGGFENSGFAGIGKRSELSGALSCKMADNVTEGIGQGNCLVGACVADGGFEERKASLPNV